MDISTMPEIDQCFEGARACLFKENGTPEELMTARQGFTMALDLIGKQEKKDPRESFIYFLLALTIHRSNFPQPGDLKKYVSCLETSSKMGNNGAKFCLAGHWYEKGRKMLENKNLEIGIIYLRDYLVLAHELSALPKEKNGIPPAKYDLYIKQMQAIEDLLAEYDADRMQKKMKDSFNTSYRRANPPFNPC